MVYHVLKDRHRLVLVCRDRAKLKLLQAAYGGVERHRTVISDLMELFEDYRAGFPTTSVGPNARKLVDAIGEVGAVINCAGVIKPYSAKDPLATLFMNGSIPHLLGAFYGEKLIQITTDCVFNGLTGAPYTERSPKTPNDLYGLSKSQGEPAGTSLVLRTSIVGPEIAGFVSLIEWLKQQGGAVVKGFTTHLWNGITTRQFGLICDELIRRRSDFPATGLYHLFSTDVTKFDMLNAFKKKYGLPVRIEPAEPPRLDRRLGSVHDLHRRLNIPSFAEMVEQL